MLRNIQEQVFLPTRPGRSFLDVIGHRGTGLSTHGHDPCLPPLTGHADKALIKIKIFKPGTAELSEAQAGRVKKLQHGEVTPAQVFVSVDRLKQCPDITLVECFG